MSLGSKMKPLLDRRGLRFSLAFLTTCLARMKKSEVRRVFYDEGAWIHQTKAGCIASGQPMVSVNASRLEDQTRFHFFWGYDPRPEDTILDIGAGMGEEVLTFSRAVGARGKVICVEAHPRTYRCLQKVVQHNRLDNVIALQKAVTGSPDETITIEDGDEYLGNRVGVSKGILVPTTTVDSLFRQFNLGNVHFLKMNIEGAERFAIHGMTEALRHMNVVCVSCHDFLAETTGDHCLRTKAEIAEYFRQNGFETVVRDYPDLPPYLQDQVWAFSKEYSQHAGKTVFQTLVSSRLH